MAAAIEELLKQTGSVLGDLTGSTTNDDDAQIHLDSCLNHGWKSFYALRERSRSSSLSICVLATCKAGKSTLLNALVGSELLPMNNVPETARIVRIVHASDVDEPVLIEPRSHGPATLGSSSASGGDASTLGRSSPTGVADEQIDNVTARGEAAVRARLQQLNHASRAHRTTSSLLPASSSRASAGLAPVPSLGVSAFGSPVNPPPAQAGADKVLTIRVPIAALKEYEGAGGVGGGVRLELLDTPGPNEAGEEGLRFQVERLLDGVDAVLYLLDYTKLKTSDEAGMFERLRSVNPALVRRLATRLFFVVNKVDASHSCEGQDGDTTREYVADLVTRQMGCEGFQLMPHQVVLLSARNGLLSRLVLADRASPEARGRFTQLAFGRFANPAAVPQDEMSKAAATLLDDSGLPDLEAQVLGYLHTHAAGIKSLALVDDLGRLLAELRNVAASASAALRSSAEGLAARVAELRVQLATTLDAFDTAQRDADRLADEVVAEVRAHLATLRGKLLSNIVSTLDTSSLEDSASGTCGRGPSRMRTGSRWDMGCWDRVRQRFLSIFTTLRGRGLWGPAATNISCAAGVRGECGGTGVSDSGDSGSSGTSVSAYYSSCDGDGGCEHSNHEAAYGTGRRVEDDVEAAVMAAAGVAVARSRSRTELVALLTGLHEDLMAQVHAEVCEFWGVLEAVAGARHAELLAALNTHLTRLTRQVESVVSTALAIVLAPVELRLERPSAETFHIDLATLISRGVVETRERHIRVGQKQVEERVLRRGGICKWGDYWESVPRLRTVVEAYTLTVYELAPAEITQHFVAVVDSAIDATQASLAGYVSHFVNEQLSTARGQLADYSGSYLGAMQGALDAGARGTEHRLAALTQVDTFVARVDGLLAQLGQLQAVTEAHVPRQRDLLAFDELDELEGGEEGGEVLGHDAHLLGPEEHVQRAEEEEVGAEVEGVEAGVHLDCDAGVTGGGSSHEVLLSPCVALAGAAAAGADCALPASAAPAQDSKYAEGSEAAAADMRAACMVTHLADDETGSKEGVSASTGAAAAAENEVGDMLGDEVLVEVEEGQGEEQGPHADVMGHQIVKEDEAVMDQVEGAVGEVEQVNTIAPVPAGGDEAAGEHAAGEPQEPVLGVGAHDMQASGPSSLGTAPTPSPPPSPEAITSASMRPGSPASVSSSLVNHLLRAPLTHSHLIAIVGGDAGGDAGEQPQPAAAATTPDPETQTMAGDTPVDAGAGGSMPYADLSPSAGRFDYSTGFLRAMSSSQVLAQAEGPAATVPDPANAGSDGLAVGEGSDDWALVEQEEGEEEQEEDAGTSSAGAVGIEAAAS